VKGPCHSSVVAMIRTPKIGEFISLVVGRIHRPRVSKLGGTDRANALAALTLITNSYLAGALHRCIARGSSSI
jgi:hypothetical protein